MRASMQVRAVPIAGAAIVAPHPFTDRRGSFVRFFCAETLADFLEERQIVQINHSRTRTTGSIRGLHFQYPPHAEMKLVRCIRGRIWDILLDLRANSPTFLHWHAEELEPDSTRMLVIPEGCAHRFQTLSPDSEVLYATTACYAPEFEGGVRYDDPRPAILWPLPVTEISERDSKHAFLSDDFPGMRF